MAAPTVADHLLERLRDWGVEHVFAFPGDGINGTLAAFGRAGNQPQFVQSRHEEMSAFEAVGYAKFSGKVGVCMATSGPGAIHLLNGLYDAKLDHVPVVAIVGQTARSGMGGAYQQEVDLLTLFKDVASEYVQMVTVPEQLPNVIDRAIRIALAERAPTAVIIPSDVQELEYSAPTHAMKMVPSSLGIQWPEVAPTTRRSGARLTSCPAAPSPPSWSARARAARRPRSRRLPSSSGRAWPRRCWARTCCPTSCPGSPARSACSAPAPATR
jgi:pyruvate dehydrogenase (quinone)